MHPARFSFLAGKHAPNRYIAARNRTSDGSWRLELECGHAGQCAAHFDCSKTQDWRCFLCGEAYVKSTKEFLEDA